jgi:hypothetical protein
MNEDAHLMTTHMSLALLRELVACLNLSAGALSVLAAAIDGRTTGRAFDPGVQPHVDAVLDTPEARKLIEGLSPVELQPVLAEIRLTILQSARLHAGDVTTPCSPTQHSSNRR